MAQITDLIIKKADGTTFITWTGDTGAAGDKIPARFSSKSVNAIPAFQPKLAVATEGNGDGSTRRVKMNLVYPYTVTDSNTTQTKEVSRSTFKGEWSVSQDMPQSSVDEFACQIANLISTALLVGAVKTQQAPT